MSDPWTSKVCDLCSRIFSSTENLKRVVSKSGEMVNPNRLLIPREMRELKISGDNGCKLCKKIWQVLHDRKELDEFKVDTPVADFHFNLAISASQPVYPNKEYPWTDIEEIYVFAEAGGKNARIGSFQVYASSDSPASAFIGVCPPDFEVGSTQSFHVANEWLRNCVANHEKCPTSTGSPLPTRVLDVCPNYGLEKLRLYASNEEKDQYAALSYCWGGPQPIMTTLATLESHQKSLAFEALPRTIQDAIVVTRELGIRYLWIDALCIIQDSLEDKGRELDKMGGIYKNAFLTISASSAASCKDGFLQTRIPNLTPERFILPFRCPDETMASVIIESEQSFNRTPPAIDKRGWTFQERLLAPRVLIYGDQGLSLECQTEEQKNGGRASRWNSVYDWRPNNPIFTKSGTSDQAKIEGFKRTWGFMVENYASRSLTFPEDKLTAISGVAEEFKRIFEDDEYLAGMWKSWILEGLVWFVNARGNGGVQPRPKEYRAPSWSWASVDGDIVYAFKPHFMGVSGITQSLTLVSCTVEPAPLNRVCGGELVLKGRLRPALWDIKNLELTKPDGESTSCETFLDSIEGGVYDSPVDVWCLQVRDNQGMILRKIEEGIYQRKGWFRTSSHASWFGDCKPVILKIL